MNRAVRILHLEDSERDAALIRDILESEGITCEIVRTDSRQDYEAALAQGDFDIILSDNNLPDYDGVSALKSARKHRPLTPVIVISGSLGEEEAVKCLQFGATDYLLKGRLERLAPAFKRALAEAEERKRREGAEEELRRNEERMRLALAATNDGIWDWDLARGTMVCNATFEMQFGCPAGSENPRDWWYEHTHPEERDVIRSSLNGAISAGQEFWQSSHRLAHRGGSWAHVQNRVCLAKNAEGKVTRLIGAVQDVTARVHADIERRQLENQLWQSQKMEAIGTLAGGISHDFNNILGIIMANADLAKRQIEEGENRDDQTVESLEEILTATRRARDLVRQILTFSRRADSGRTLIAVQPVVQECLKLLRSTIPAMVSINEHIDPSCPAILGDATQMHQVVMNICTNAWHALPERGGVIDVRVEETTPDRELIEKNPDLDEIRYVKISVRDNGHGMDEKIRARIFEPFYTTKPVGKGTGLGLSVVHGIVRSHDGVIVLDSAPGRGTTFDLYFPAKAEGATPALRATTALPRGSGQRILIVDDDVGMGKVLQRVFKQYGYSAQCCHHPEVALDTLRNEPRAFDLVITDYAMPGMTGVDLAERIVQLSPHLPVLLITGSMGLQGMENTARSPAIRGILPKPATREILLEGVARALKARSGQ